MRAHAEANAPLQGATDSEDNMSVIPPSREGKIQFYEAHIGKWAENAAQIGLGPTAVANLTALVEAARGAFTAAETARAASRSATQAFYEAVRDMHNAPGAGSDMLQTIRIFAETSNNPDVYNLADIPPPSAGEPLPPPGQPGEFTVSLDPMGPLTLKWKCENPAGRSVVYMIRRKLAGESQWTLIGGAGAREFTDVTLPAGVDNVSYSVTAQRASVSGVPSLPLVISFGGAGGGSGVSVKLAA